MPVVLRSSRGLPEASPLAGGALTRRVSGIDLSGNAVRMKGVRGTGNGLRVMGFGVRFAGLLILNAGGDRDSVEGSGYNVQSLGIRPSTSG